MGQNSAKAHECNKLFIFSAVIITSNTSFITSKVTIQCVKVSAVVRIHLLSNIKENIKLFNYLDFVYYLYLSV